MMRRGALAGLALYAFIASGAHAASCRIAGETAGGWPKLVGCPRDVILVVQRMAECTHLSGEFGGEQTERDREVAKAMEDLHCERVDKAAQRVTKKYAKRDDISKTLHTVLEVTIPNSY